MVACTDELACLLLVGRVDRWLALDDFLRERFVVSKPTGSVGVYAGAPVVSRLADLFTTTTPPPTRVLVIDVFKELPVGHSSTFLARALAAEGMSGETRIETTQLRVVELLRREVDGDGHEHRYGHAVQERRRVFPLLDGVQRRLIQHWD